MARMQLMVRAICVANVSLGRRQQSPEEPCSKLTKERLLTPQTKKVYILISKIIV